MCFRLSARAIVTITLRPIPGLMIRKPVTAFILSVYGFAPIRVLMVEGFLLPVDLVDASKGRNSQLASARASRRTEVGKYASPNMGDTQSSYGM